jgi:prepilin signal peptidase PulO-like enzyme (type II secretory pathway)
MIVIASPLLDAAKTVLIHAAPGMPPEYWWMTACILSILALASTIDAFTGIVPDSLIFLGMLAVTGTQGMIASWPVAGTHLRHAVEAGLLVWLTNFLWYAKFHHDALGMGDAKWTMLAVACFGPVPGIFAWGVGSVLAVIFIGASRLVRFQVTQLTFAPFLFIGLTIGLYWVRFSI